MTLTSTGIHCRAKNPTMCAVHGNPGYISETQAASRVLHAVVGGSFEDYEEAREAQQKVKDIKEAQIWFDGFRGSAANATAELNSIQTPGVRIAAEHIIEQQKVQDSYAQGRAWVKQFKGHLKNAEARLDELSADERIGAERKIKSLRDEKENAARRAKRRRQSFSSNDYSNPLTDPSSPINMSNQANWSQV